LRTRDCGGVLTASTSSQSTTKCVAPSRMGVGGSVIRESISSGSQFTAKRGNDFDLIKENLYFICKASIYNFCDFIISFKDEAFWQGVATD